jgi:hypothetical protein
VSLIYDNHAEAGAASAPTCNRCGGFPATEAVFRGYVVFLIFVSRSYRRGPLCRDCGIAAFRDLTARTLAGAWYGPLAVVALPYAIVCNLLNRAKVARLPAPQYARPPHWQDAPGRPLLLRWQAAGFLIPLALIGCFVGLMFLGSSQSPAEPAPRDTAIGQCVDIGEDTDSNYLVTVVDCATAHNGKIVSATTKAAGCPPDQSLINFEPWLSRVYCVEAD